MCLFGGHPLRVPAQGFGSYVMENVLFKISFPAEFHAQTAVEAAIILHPLVAKRLDEIERVVIETQESGKRIIDKTGPLDNPADRDHCIQYMVAVPLIFGRLTAEDYEDAVACDPRIDRVRIRCRSSNVKSLPPITSIRQSARSAIACRSFSRMARRPTASLSNTRSATVAVARRGYRRLLGKFERNLRGRIPTRKADAILTLFTDHAHLDATLVHRFMDLFVV